MPIGIKTPKTIRGKLLFITLSGVLSALLVSSIVLFLLDIVRYRQYLRHEMIGLCQVVAENCGSALLFGDTGAATSVLASVEQDPRVKAAYVMVPGKGVFASYESPSWKESQSPPQPSPEGSVAFFLRDHLVISSPVLVQGEMVGWVSLYVSLRDFYSRIWIFAGILVIVAFLSAFLGWLLIRRLQYLILTPIQELSVASRLITHEKNYKYRVVKRHDDEIGTLVDFYNEMLGQIQHRDTELTQARDELEDRVLARTRQLEKEVDERKRAQQVVNNLLMKISDDNEKLVKLDEMKSEFLSIVSHELRTPLTAISGYLKLMVGGSAGPVNETQKEFLQTVLRNSDRLGQLVNDLLDLSRLEAGKIQLKYGQVDAGTLLEQSVKGLRSLAEQKKIHLSVLKPDPSISFEADAARLEQVLVNLLGNSLKFTLANGKVEVGARPENNAGAAWVTLWVHDNGVGIPKDSLDKIFSKFYQVENSSTRKAGGSGLGLAITQKLVEAHGGTIRVASVEGQGSTFWISIPSVRPKEEPKEEKS